MSKMLHLDLFSGIGGFAYAADQVFGNVEHIFCDNDKFCQQVLKKHWPESEIYDDIKTITHTEREGWWTRPVTKKGQAARPHNGVDLLTGGFPCQPFSAAGVRRGTSDDRYLWPEMLKVIRAARPAWVIAENVRGLLTWEQGVVVEQVCLDLEASNYEVQPLIIPAVSLDSPHRRDRIWFVAHRTGNRWQRPRPQAKAQEGHPAQPRIGGQLPSRLEGQDSWSRDWHEVATEFCGVDDGLPAELDGFKLTKPQHRKERIKSLGNAIVPQVAMEIMKGFIMTPNESTAKE